MSKNKGGRPPKYSLETLKQELYKYAEMHPEGRITPGKLAKATGIPLHVWRDRMKASIERLNKEAIAITVLNDTSFELPNCIADLLSANGNEKKLVAFGERYNQLIMDMACEIQSLQVLRKESAILMDKVDKLTKELESEKVACSEYKRIITQIAIDSHQSVAFRQHYGLDDLLNEDAWRRLMGREPNDLSISENDEMLATAINDFNSINE